MTLRSVEEMGATLPQSFAISLVMQESPSENPWIDASWDAVGILPERKEQGAQPPAVELIQAHSGIRQHLFRGFRLRLHVDECESYYHNLLAPAPCCYVVASVADDGTPQPMLVTLSFDEAHAYLEGEGNLYTVPMPPEVYRWTETFVLAHYVPTQRTRRKRQDWRQTGEDKPQ